MDSAAASIMLGVERDWIQKVGLVFILFENIIGFYFVSLFPTQ